MRIGFDITAIGDQPSGVGNYALHLLNHMAAAEPDDDFLLLSNRPVRPAELTMLPNMRRMPDHVPSRMAWLQGVLPRTLRAMQPDLCHFPNSITPLWSPYPSIVTIHDMTLSVLSRYHPWRKQVLVRPFVPLVARRARRVITVSQHARADIVRLLRLPPERVVVIPEAAAPIFRPASSTEQERVRRRYHLDGPFILYVGTLEPRKNLVRLIRGWDRLRRAGAIPHRLVIVGAPGWQHRPIFEAVRALRCEDAITFTGYVPTADLPGLYSAADLFAFPSLYEGFGLPVVEAMASGTPVLISPAPALVEVAGNAAFQTRDYSEEGIAAGLATVLSDRRLHDELRERGLRRAGEFSWHTAALRTLEVYMSVAGHSSTVVDNASAAPVGGAVTRVRDLQA
jgi:glycosyltransferase involved in cell wall biosynthesis